MTDAWFAGANPDNPESGAQRIREGRTDSPEEWPAEAVEDGFAADETDYYAKLRSATLAAARDAVAERERADDVQLAHAVRAMDDAERTANELAERVVEWAGTLYENVPRGLDGVRDIAERDPSTAAEERVVSYATRAVDLLDERDQLRTFIEERAPTTAPNLAEMAGPVLAARLISLAGGLDSLAKAPSGTVQVLGAEDALFAHLKGRATSPKHGVIFTHEYVHGTRPQDRGSAARAFAGKLSIAARIDHYSGDYRPEIHDELAERMATIRARDEEDDQ
ncbi:NOP58 family protein [Haloferax mediterranei ATCC 33500]|uniref:NOP58 family protein n=1 Tax=Haloferax mediterranei (strain ATCC 33500 / DSM 1411 / JCM 8866 / NBRC 14739 / NCIMB 2177 / R-4) TaxID=523841 RepID=I3R5F8_HALMT|nr:NOP5/NOP56 family protein [Haloferax mediterranei]AFK19468.1 nucleolar protein-like protein [Haloferax mediterranei ATCC 33500]AHZ21186.1 nucleolar [Haloferax mediterranei ATCC 33500]EMA04345.1 nucleolar protein-like protein [Haloferax mediterranei ATCC 33500]MDX5989570.1 NOP5/NOP56 family protein [Haloferax mediterranei ATCC 33500]QCQ75928.1 NOP58 family protein [Haloferax mediterranei ATCC 33500]